MKTIDMTPTWTAVLPIYIQALRHGDPEGIEAARAELERMAKAADLWNAQTKKGGAK